MSRSSIQTVVKYYNKCQTTENHHRSGRSSKLTDHDERDVNIAQRCHYCEKPRKIE